MGLPLGKLICASNANNVLTDFLSTGTYDRNRKFHTTMSPSMDILISSNLERLLCFASGEEKTAGYMAELAANGRYTVDAETKNKIDETFIGFCADETMTAQTLNKFYSELGYLADTHTSVALNCAEQYISQTGDSRKIIVASTASPYKFAADVYKSITNEDANSDTEALDQLSKLTDTEISYPLRNLTERKVNFDAVINPDEMLEAVYKFM